MYVHFVQSEETILLKIQHIFYLLFTPYFLMLYVDEYFSLEISVRVHQLLIAEQIEHEHLIELKHFGFTLCIW